MSHKLRNLRDNLMEELERFADSPINERESLNLLISSAMPSSASTQFALWKAMTAIPTGNIVITTQAECIAITIQTAIWVIAEAMAISADTAEMKLRTDSLTRWKA